MSLLDRLRRLFSGSEPEPEPDHPLSEAEREGVPQTTRDESASLIDEFVDPGDPR
jgi:hypothetical protein